MDKKKENRMGTLIRILILSWSAALLTASYAGALSKMDPTFIATVFTASAATFGINTMKKGGDDDEDHEHQRREPTPTTFVEPTPTYSEPTVEPTESSEVSDSGDSPDYSRASTNI